MCICKTSDINITSSYVAAILDIDLPQHSSSTIEKYDLENVG